MYLTVPKWFVGVLLMVSIISITNALTELEQSDAFGSSPSQSAFLNYISSHCAQIDGLPTHFKFDELPLSYESLYNETSFNTTLSISLNVEMINCRSLNLTCSSGWIPFGICTDRDPYHYHYGTGRCRYPFTGIDCSECLDAWYGEECDQCPINIAIHDEKNKIIQCRHHSCALGR